MSASTTLPAWHGPEQVVSGNTTHNRGSYMDPHLFEYHGQYDMVLNKLKFIQGDYHERTTEKQNQTIVQV